MYGVVGLKTHTKLALVVRQEADGMRCYAHIGTGNYHVKTAKLYTDVGMFTCDPALTEDVVDLFHFLTGRSRKRDYQKMLVSPLAMRSRFVELIEREAAHARAGRPARIVAKMNQLEDPELCESLCSASNAGVEIDLIVRGFCCLLPGLAGISERIRVISVIGRFLEHSRIFHFANGSADPQEGDYFIGSADWMYRNLSARVEAIAPVENPVLKERLWESPRPLPARPSPGLGHAARWLDPSAHSRPRSHGRGPGRNPGHAHGTDKKTREGLPDLKFAGKPPLRGLPLPQPDGWHPVRERQPEG